MGRHITRLPISLVIPAFMAQAHIRSAIESVSSQAVVPAEIIVVDDASSDHTGEIAAAAGAHVIRLPLNAGPSVARNTGVAAASQPWVAFLDADDLWLDGKLAAQWQAIGRWPDAGFCFTDSNVLGPNGNVEACETGTDRGYRSLRPRERAGDLVRFAQDDFARGLVTSMFIRQSSVIVNRDLFLRSGGYDERLRLAEDQDLFLRLIGLAPAIAVERAFVTYVRRPLSLSSDPLAVVWAIDRLWSAIVAHPDRYPQPVRELIPQRRQATLQLGATLALRLGRFAEAIPFARKALTFDRSPLSLALLGLSAALDNPAGDATFRVARSIWHAR
jgi:glycosyltransferase involved in cell wall biosynthesis